MKNKTKLMLALSILTAGTLAAGATGTFAWFTTNKTATATYSKITVQGTNGNLGVTIKGVTESGTDKDSKEYEPTASFESAQKISDVSSKDGLHFYQPVFSGQSGIESTTKVDSISEITADGYFVQYLVSLKNKNTKDGNSDNADSATLVVSLNNVVIEGGTNAKNWTRVAINKYDATPTTEKRLNTNGNNQLGLFQNDASSGKTSYIKGTDVTKTHTLADVLDDCSSDITVASDVKNSPIEIGNIEVGGVVNLGVSVWFEGTMSNNQDNAKGEQINVTLDFIGEPKSSN